MMISKYISVSFFSLFILASCSTSSNATKSQAQPGKPITTQAPTPAKSSADISKAIAGEWVITAVDTKVLEFDEDIPYITFVPAENKFYGSNGCNIINGSYELSPAGLITFKNSLSTMRYCPNVTFDSDINNVIKDDTSLAVKFETIGNESYMIFSANGRQLMTLRRSNMDFLNGKWQVTQINGQAIDDEEANVFFDIYEKKIHGNTGCNYFNGDIMFDPAEANSINLSSMGVTRMACYKGDQERNMLVALEEATTVVRGGNDTVMLLNKSGKTVLTLKRVPITNTNE